MTLSHRPLLALILVSWTIMLLACGARPTTSERPADVEPVKNTTAKSVAAKAGDTKALLNARKEIPAAPDALEGYFAEEARLLAQWTDTERKTKPMMDGLGLSDNEKQFVTKFLNTTWDERIRAELPPEKWKPSLDLNQPLNDGDIGVPYFGKKDGVVNELTVSRVVNDEELIVVNNIWWRGVKQKGHTIMVKGVNTSGARANGPFVLNGIFFVAGTSPTNPGVPVLATINVDKLRKFSATAEYKEWLEINSKLQRVKRQIRTERQAQEAAAEAERSKQAAIAQAERLKQEEELDCDGLVLLRKTVQGAENSITGIVVNRRGHALRYVQIEFYLYDASGAQVGTALGNIANLEAGGTWKFQATTFGVRCDKFKFAALKGY